MIESLYSFFVTDHSSRWRAIAWSWGIGTAVGMIASATQASESELGLLTVGASFVALSCFVVAYTQPESQRAEAPIKSRRTVMNFVYATSAAMLFVEVERLLAGPQAVHAAVSVAIKEMRANEPVSKPTLLTIHSRLRKILTTHKTQDGERESLLSDYAGLKAALVYSETQKAPITDLPPETKTTRSGKKFTFRFMPPAPKVMFQGGCYYYAFTSIDFLSKTPGSSIVDPRADCHLFFSDSLIQGFTQKLDYVTWVDVIFERCSIIYEGGQLTLVNVVMRECQIDIAPGVSSEIRKRLLDTTKPITLTSDFVQ